VPCSKQKYLEKDVITWAGHPLYEAMRLLGRSIRGMPVVDQDKKVVDKHGKTG
jgi:CBS domain-containing protein